VVEMLLCFDGMYLSVAAMDVAKANGRQEVVDLLMGQPFCCIVKRE